MRTLVVRAAKKPLQSGMHRTRMRVILPSASFILDRALQALANDGVKRTGATIHVDADASGL